ncbi:lysozyme inhibitor LprI family protein [Brevundimonas aveniformis]|uniref:lysozyme inhibitor LprI family protein n=1 Tax=Brevundimonas aveniformis TaxID=370977 RepID=UPI002492A850|nr:lysozyme inhibitor LprI family protein [Brevundimonas aveniformis]
MSQMIACGAADILAERERQEEYLRAAHAQAFSGGERTALSAYLDASQSAWESYAEIECRAEAQRHSGGLMETVIYQGCLREMTYERTHSIWSSYLRGGDGQRPILPEPDVLADR